MAKPLSQSFAQISSSTINTTIKLSVCGDSVVEGPEDCEGSDLNGKSCTSLGYSGGSLSCDIACSFDKSSCISPTPTPTATPTPTPIQSGLTPAPTSSDSSPTNTPAPTTTVTATTSPTEAPKPTLPAALQIFDVSGVGKILASDLPVVVKLWVDEWKKVLTGEVQGIATSTDLKRCDINLDQNCDMKDFSVLMYFVDR